MDGSMARHLVNCSTNALEIAYPIASGIAIIANPLETLIMLPLVLIRCGIANLHNSTVYKEIEKETSQNYFNWIPFGFKIIT